MLWPLTVLPAKFGGGSLPLHTRLPTIVMPPPMFNPPAPVVLFWKSALPSEPVQFGEAPAVESLILSRRRPSTYQSKWRAKFFELDQGLTIRWRVQQTALAPKFIQATIKTKWRTRSEIALEDFTVVADLLSNVVSPFGIKAEVRCSSPSRPSKRRVSGSVELATTLSTFSVVTPFSSSMMVA